MRNIRTSVAPIFLLVALALFGYFLYQNNPHLHFAQTVNAQEGGIGDSYVPDVAREIPPTICFEEAPVVSCDYTNGNNVISVAHSWGMCGRNIVATDYGADGWGVPTVWSGGEISSRMRYVVFAGPLPQPLVGLREYFGYQLVGETVSYTRGFNNPSSPPNLLTEMGNISYADVGRKTLSFAAIPGTTYHVAIAADGQIDGGLAGEAFRPVLPSYLSLSTNGPNTNNIAEKLVYDTRTITGIACLPPTPPTIELSCNPGGKSVNFSWGASTNATHYYPRVWVPTGGCPAGWTMHADGHSCYIGGETPNVIDGITTTSINFPLSSEGIHSAWVFAGINGHINPTPATNNSFFCTATPNTPTNPSGSCTGTTMNISWSLPTNATIGRLRVDDLTTGTSLNCSALTAGEVCTDTNAPWSSTAGISGHNYHWWVYSSNVAGDSTTPLEGSFTCAAASAETGALTVSPTPCVIPSGATTCTFNTSWTTTNVLVGPTDGIRLTFTPQGGTPFNMLNDGSPAQYTNLPAYWGVGTHLVKLYASKTGALLDTKQVLITQPLPDLTATVVTPTTVDVNTPNTFFATAVNSGSTATPAGFTSIFQVATAASGGGVITEYTVTTTSLGSAASRALSRSHTLTTPGTVSMRLCVDKASSAGLGTITESNEGNNCGPWTSITVRAPDLTASAITPITATGNTATTFSSTITNTGIQTLTGFPVLFQLETNGAVTNLTAVDTPVLGLNTSRPVTMSHTFTSPATYRMRACADASSAFTSTITESNEGNNCGPWTPLTVSFTGVNVDFHGGGCVLPAGGGTCNITSYWTVTGLPTGETVDLSAIGPGLATKKQNLPLTLAKVRSALAAVYGSLSPTRASSLPYLVPVSQPGTFNIKLLQHSNGTQLGTAIALVACPSGNTIAIDTNGVEYCVAPGSPDLTAGAVTPTTAILGVATTLSSSVSVTGAGTGSGFTSVFQINPDAITDIFNAISALRTDTSPALTVGSSDPITASYTFPTAGTYYVRACADTNTSNVGTITESNEGNNCGPWTYIVVTSTPSCSGPCTTSHTNICGDVIPLNGTKNSSCECIAMPPPEPLTCTVVPPTASLTLSALPTRVRNGNPTNLTWSAQNVQGCILRRSTGAEVERLDATLNTIASHTVSSGPIVSQTTFTLSCVDLGSATVSTSVSVRILPSTVEI